VLDGWQGFSKVGVRNAMVIAAASACLAVDERSHSLRLALGAVAPTVVRCVEAEQFVAAEIAAGAIDLTGRRSTWSDGAAAIAARFGELAATASAPIDDHRSTARYRRHAVTVMAERLLRRAI